MPQLRNHPKMTWGGRPSWPPRLTTGWGETSRACEEGVLHGVELLATDTIDPIRLKLAIKYECDVHSVLVCCDDPDFLSPLYEKLKQCVGQPMLEIGSSEIDF